MSQVKYLNFWTADGVNLKGSLFCPDSNFSFEAERQSVSVLINSATGAPRSYYERFASFLADMGCTVLTYDYRGLFDSSQGKEKDDLSSMRDWGELDTEAALNFLISIDSSARLSFVGHSIGGTLLGLAPSNTMIQSAVSVASPSGHWRHWPISKRFFSFFAYTVFVPAIVALTGKLPARYVGTSLPKGIALEWARWCRHPDFVVDESGQSLRQSFERYRGPYLFYCTTDDIFAPPDSVHALVKLFKNSKNEVRVIKPKDWGVGSIGHFGFFRKTAPIAFWQEIAERLMTYP